MRRRGERREKERRSGQWWRRNTSSCCCCSEPEACPGLAGRASWKRRARLRRSEVRAEAHISYQPHRFAASFVT